MSHGRSQRRKAKWGQNFLINQGACRRIVDALGDLRGQVVIEIGPGRGALTRLLAERAARALVVEVDPVLAAELEAAFPAANVVVLLRDALDCDWTELTDTALADDLAPPVAFVSNLPYESGTAILQRWLAASASDARLDRAVVMLQAEVAERVAARPGTKAHGLLSVLAQATHEVGTVFDVAPGSFRPVPKVWSRVLRLRRRADPSFAPEERSTHAAFLRAAFAHRRKQLASDLAGVRGLDREAWKGLLLELGHPDTARAEELSVDELIALSRRALP